MNPDSILYTPLSADAPAIVEASGHHDGMLLVVAAKPLDARRLVDEIRWFCPQKRVCLLPDWETLPYERFSPHQDLISERLYTLYAITKEECDIAIVAATTALYRLPPVSFLAAHVFFLKPNDRLSVDAFRKQLGQAGYAHVNQVIAPGEYAVRGGLIDLFPMGVDRPFRIDLFDDEIESIRIFDVDTQRTFETVDQIRLLPAREFPTDDAARSRFRANFREIFEGDPSKSQLYKDITAGLLPSGIDYYLPLFFEDSATLFDYVEADTRIVLHGAVAQEIQPWWADVDARYQLLKGDVAFPLLAPRQLFLAEDQFFGQINRFSHQTLLLADHHSLAETNQSPFLSLPNVAISREQPDDPLFFLRQFADKADGRILITADSLGRQDTLMQLMAAHGLRIHCCDSFAAFLSASEKVMMTVSPVMAGFMAKGYALITEAELYPSTARAKRQRRYQNDNRLDHFIKDLVELKTGEMVVHQQYGISCYEGLVTKDFGEGSTEFLVLAFAGDDKLYVPVSQLHVISRYHGSDTTEPNKLGSSQWEKTKKKAAAQARDTAAELLLHYARRAARSGVAFTVDVDAYQVFCDQFPFEETDDQKQAIDAVLADMTAEKPMDRLVCGDVGFGKTEVALRAAFVAAMNGSQVAMLAPTTLLVEQHYQNFASRFANVAIRVVNLSRFRSAKEIRQVLEDLQNGKADIVIGTHRLLQEDVVFKNLGLVVIDEEHRFGVRQKEKLKMLRTEVDTLRLTATPIPRSLAMSIEGLSDYSIIATAPQKRLSIRTMVQEYSAGIIREACLREIKRGGQIYFLHNKVSTIETMRETLQKIIPEAAINVGHGKMHERDLERVMRDFVQQRFNLLLCTTIIETGIDIPNANTIIIDRADKFGLAQLHQLRGRVGRSHHQAYAYLLTPAGVKLSQGASKRLDAIRSMQDLGSGFYLAMHDLEIRGAGEVLGEAQSGEIQAVGFELFQKMLNKAVDALKKGEASDSDISLTAETEVNLHMPALLPANYCHDIHERLTLYKRLSDCDNLEALTWLREELIDRFGQLPDQAACLIYTHQIRIMCYPLDIEKLDATEEQIVLQFQDNPKVDAYRIIELIQNNKDYKMAGQNKLAIRKKTQTLAERVGSIQDILIALTVSTDLEKEVTGSIEQLIDRADNKLNNSSQCDEKVIMTEKQRKKRVR